MNVHDHLKNLDKDQIKTYCESNTIDATVAMMRIHGDFNLSTVIRNANFFGFKETAYVSPRRKWDRRGTVGTHHYTPLMHFYTEKDFVDHYRGGHTLVAVENNIPKYEHKSISLNEMTIMSNPVFIFGEEQNGLEDSVLDQVDIVVTIPAFGSVRSLNVGTTSGIVMCYYRNLIETSRSCYRHLTAFT